MINVLGLPLELAVKLLERDGYTVETAEARSLKGVAGDSLRVVRQGLCAGSGGSAVQLVYCEFKTNVGEA